MLYTGFIVQVTIKPRDISLMVKHDATDIKFVVQVYNVPSIINNYANLIL